MKLLQYLQKNISYKYLIVLDHNYLRLMPKDMNNNMMILKILNQLISSNREQHSFEII